MKFSVIIPCFNAEAFLDQTLQSCIDQGEVLGEVIVVDDGSTDGSHALAKRWEQQNKKIQVIHNPRKGGQAARNTGLEYARHPLIQWLDADDVLGAEKLNTAQAFHHANPNQLLACPWFSYRNEGSAQQLVSDVDWKQISANSSPEDWIARDVHMAPHCYSGSRNLFIKTGPWDETLTINQDGEYFTRVIAQSEGVHFTTDVAVHYRRGLSNSTSQFSPSKVQSLFQSIQSIQAVAFELESSLRMRQMMANRWQHFIYTAYPHSPELISAAKEKLKSLPTPNISNPNAVSGFSKMISKTFGWKALTQARMLRSLFTS